MFHLDQPSHTLKVLTFGCILMSQTASAAVAVGSSESFKPCAIEATVHNVATSGWQQVQRVSVVCGTNEFDFVAPEGLRLSADADRLTLVASNSAYILTFRILNSATAEPSQETQDSQREFLLEQFPNAKLIEQFSRTVAKRTGPAFELRLSADNGTQQTVWVAHIPCAGGFLEFSCHAQRARASEAKVAFNSFLRTFRSNQDGKLIVLPTRPQDS